MPEQAISPNREQIIRELTVEDHDRRSAAIRARRRAQNTEERRAALNPNTNTYQTRGLCFDIIDSPVTPVLSAAFLARHNGELTGTSSGDDMSVDYSSDRSARTSSGDDMSVDYSSDCTDRTIGSPEL